LNIGLLGWFIASGLYVTVKQPDSRRILGFIVSVVTQFDGGLQRHGITACFPIGRP
jgi:hypothetical protein